MVCEVCWPARCGFRTAAKAMTASSPFNAILGQVTVKALFPPQDTARLAKLNKGQSPADTYTKKLLYELKDFQTKLRPGVFDLLQKLQHMFRLYIYTMGDEAYACAMANLIDPSGSLFRNRILNRSDANWAHHQKGLDKLGVPPSMAVVVDDTVGMSLPLWIHFVSNVHCISYLTAESQMP